MRTGFGIAPVNKLVSLTWHLWALRSFRSFTLHYITLQVGHVYVMQGKDMVALSLSCCVLMFTNGLFHRLSIFELLVFRELCIAKFRLNFWRGVLRIVVLNDVYKFL